MEGLSVLIPTHNNARYLELCLYALGRNNTLDNEIIIHIDGSTDNTVEVIEKHKKATGLNIIVSESEYRGLYSGVNSALRNATKEYYVLINDDIIVGPDWDINFVKACKPNRIMCPWMIEKGNGSYTQGVSFGDAHTPEDFDFDRFDDYVIKNMKDEFITPWVVGMYSWKLEYFKRINGCDEAFNPFGRGGKEAIYRMKILYPEFEFGAIKNSMVYHFSAACKRENNRDHLVNLKTWDEKYPEIESQEANDLLEGKRNYKPIEQSDEFVERCLYGHIGKGLY